DSDGEISILRIEEANNVITKLMQAIPEVVTCHQLVYIGNSVRTKRRRRQIQKKDAVGTPKLELFWLPTVNMHTNVDNIGSDSDFEIFEDGFEIETVEGHNITSYPLIHWLILSKNWKKKLKAAFSNLPSEACI
ncbi:15022_t:CDS:2, partial [Gigaspora rosea]